VPSCLLKAALDTFVQSDWERANAGNLNVSIKCSHVCIRRAVIRFAEQQVHPTNDERTNVIAEESAGIPREINRICEKSLMYTFQPQRKLVDDCMVNFVIALTTVMGSRSA